MATISSITVTRTSNNVTYSPSDWYSGSIYSDATIKCVDDTGDGYDASFWLFDASDNILAAGDVPAGQTKTLSQLFSGKTLVGNYLGDAQLHRAKIVARTSKVGAPSNVKLAETVSCKAVRLSWKAGSAGTGNSVTGYDVQYADSADGSTWGSWQTASGSPVSGTSINVDPPATTGHYRKFRVRTRGSAGSSYYSAYVTSTNTLRKDHDALEGFTDSPLTAGMYVKALHMTELHDRVNTLRGFYGLSAYAFSPIDDRGIAGWTDHVNEIKEAIEDVCTASGKTHEAWIEFSVNCPRADVIEQLRAAVLAL